VALSRRTRAFFASPLAIAGAVILFALVLAAIAAPSLAPHDPAKMHDTYDARTGASAPLPPGPEFRLGTDSLGRDVLSRVIWGARISLVIALASIGLAAFAGVPLGGIAGYAGGFADAALMRATDVLLALPSIVLALTISAALGRGLSNVILAVAISQAPVFARQMRAAVLELRERDFVLASRALGAGPARILFARILPNALGPLVVIATLGLGEAVLEAAGLGFLGLGAEPGTPEWGTMLSDNVDYLRGYPWISLYPGLAIALVVLGFNLVGDGARRALDPRA
jgi:peptide/nickel transport system permease protein